MRKEASGEFMQRSDMFLNPFESITLAVVMRIDYGGKAEAKRPIRRLLPQSRRKMMVLSPG